MHAVFDDQRSGRLSTAGRFGPSQALWLDKFRSRYRAELCRGRELDEIAAMRQVTTGALRVQLKAILLETGTQRQSDVVVPLFRYSRSLRQRRFEAHSQDRVRGVHVRDLLDGIIN